jgi:hypothetical protein
MLPRRGMTPPRTTTCTASVHAAVQSVRVPPCVARAFAGPPTGEGGAVCRSSPSISRSDSMQVEAGARRRIRLAATTPANAHYRSPSLSSRSYSVPSTHVGIQTFRKTRSSRRSCCGCCCCCCGGCIATCRFEGSYDRMRYPPWRVCCSRSDETASPVRSEIAPWPPTMRVRHRGRRDTAASADDGWKGCSEATCTLHIQHRERRTSDPALLWTRTTRNRNRLLVPRGT